MRSSRISVRGLTLVELLVAMVISLVLMGGLASLFLFQARASRRLVEQLRMQQDLGAVAQLVVRRVRSDDWTISDAIAKPATQFRLSAGAVQMKAGSANWQSLTDIDTIHVAALSVTPTLTETPLGASCTPFCLNETQCPRLVSARVDIRMVATSAFDSGVQRETGDTIGLRRSVVLGACP